jgi:hypothetical protein
MTFKQSRHHQEEKMKSKNTVGLFGNFHGLLPKLNIDLSDAGFTPIMIGIPA